MAHAFNLSTLDRWISEFQASLVYTVHSRTARTTKRDPDLRTKPKLDKDIEENPRK